MHAWHKQNGAQTAVLDGWVRVLAYGDSQAEIQASRGDVGICDVSPIVKIDVQGKRSGELLQQVSGVPMPEVGHCASFTHKGYSKPMYVARLARDKYLVFAKAGLREQLYRTLADEALELGCAHINDVTSAYAAVQFVGPMATTLLKKLGSAPIDHIQLDRCVQTATARVWSLLIHHEARQGTAWLMLVSRDFGEYVWESVLAAGQKFGIRPFGLLAAQVITGMEEVDVATL